MYYIDFSVFLSCYAIDHAQFAATLSTRIVTLETACRATSDLDDTGPRAFVLDIKSSPTSPSLRHASAPGRDPSPRPAHPLRRVAVRPAPLALPVLAPR